jgi:glutamate/tyrosine decarboxylase-like PLP-dependent enzyme
MSDAEDHGGLDPLDSPLEMAPEEFRALGHGLIDRLADFLESVPSRPGAPDLTAAEARARIGAGALPQEGAPAGPLLDEALDLLAEGCRLNGHPRSWGYVIGTPAPIAILADFIAATVNPNMAAWHSAPVPAEIELQAVRWIAEFLGYPADCGGLLVSGGNMANFVGVLAARRARTEWDLRREGLAAPDTEPLTLYASRETHTWIEKAADLFGLGTEAIRWIETDAARRMDTAALRAALAADRRSGRRPFLLVGSAGTVSTGAVDPLPDLAEIAREQDLWFHVDGAYGAPAVAARGLVPEDLAPADLEGLRLADSLAVDAHKWLFVPLEAGCALVRDRRALRDTFSYRPPYYHYRDVGDEVVHFHEYGPQNSRACRALKVWLALRRVGARHYAETIARNLRQSRRMAEILSAQTDFESATQSLSIATFRYVPPDLRGRDGPEVDDYLDRLNTEMLMRAQRGRPLFLSNALLDGRFHLRACITNFRTRESDLAALPELLRPIGKALDRELRPEALR